MKKVSGYSSDSEQNSKQDLSVLTKPIATGLTGFLEAKRAYDNGTEEVRRILSRECDILYECKICRNIFRSLTNFISHKRVYCRTAFSNLTNQANVGNGHIDVATIIQEEQDFVKNNPTKDNKYNENANKDLSSIIERLLKREQSNRLMQLSDFYDQVSNKLTQDDLLRKKHELQLDRVPNSSVAVYQTVKKEKTDDIKKEVNEIHELMIGNKRSMIGLDGKIILKQNAKASGCDKDETKFKECNQKSQDTERISCDICGLEFTTEKTLKLHLQTKHISATYVYQCPSCSQTFLQPHAVYRHLSNEHKKSIRRIRTMRESILKRRIRIDEVQTKAPSRELARLQTDSEKRETDSKSWMNKPSLSSTSPMCPYCGKTFERKAVLTTHLNNCSMKNKCPGPQTRRHTEMGNSNNANEHNRNISQGAPSILNGYDLNELRDIKEMDLNNANGRSTPKSNVQPRDISPVNKRKRKRTSKVLQTPDTTTSDRTESLDDLFWNIESSVEKMSLKTVSLDNSPSSTPPPKLDSPPPSKDPTPEKDTAASKTVEPLPIKKMGKSSESTSKSYKQVSFYCRICVKKFDVLSNLRRHISMFHYRKRKFGCKLCDYRAFRKYDVINHLNSNHSITGEREEVLHYVVVKELKTDRIEENIDADVIVDENGTFGATLVPKLVEKRRRRGKMKEVPTYTTDSPPKEIDVNSSPKSEPNFARTPSNLSLSSNEEGSSSSSISKRPIRNRVKPVNKDFVYDLSNLLKKDMVLSEKTQRRRNTQTVDESSRDSVTPPTTATINSVPPTETQQLLPRVEPEICTEPIIDPNIKGAALKMAQSAVDSFSACFVKPPELPLERPCIIARIAPSVNIFEPRTTDWPQHKPLEIRRPSEDNILHSFGKRRRLDESFKSNRKSLNGDSVKSKAHRDEINGKDKIAELFAKETSRLEESATSGVELMKFVTPSTLVTNGDNVLLQSQTSVIKSATSSSPPTTKRITLLQRMTENKKIREDTQRYSETMAIIKEKQNIDDV